MRIALSVVLICFAHTVVAQWVVKKDLHDHWLISDSTNYRPYQDDSRPTTVYVSIPVRPFQGDYFVFRSTVLLSIVINGVVVLDGVKRFNLSIDSLEKRYPANDFFVALHSNSVLSEDNLETFVASKVLYPVSSPEKSYLKASTVFRDFSITAALIMVIFLVSIIRLNPGLSADYFSIRRMFSNRESEDDHYYYRVTSATILFYVFTSLMIGLFMMIIIRFTGVRFGIEGITTASYSSLLGTWLTVSSYVLVFLFMKIVTIYLISVLFGIREIAGYHFFNFVRILLITLGILSLVLLIYFVLHGQGESFYTVLFATLPWILGIWIVLGFFKLASRVHHSAFHLFSYICATELIPFFIIIEVLNK
jgi:Domain of unknown function (DUF4271)